MENFSVQWFTAYYISLGALLITYGLYLFLKTGQMKAFLLNAAQKMKAPPVMVKVLKYLLLFTLPCLILSFLPFSWIELLFSIWSFVIIITAGQFLLLWPQTSKAILKSGDQLDRKIRFVAANMISIGIILFLLCFVILDRTKSIT
jgi:uncharacterized membrane protein